MILLIVCDGVGRVGARVSTGSRDEGVMRDHAWSDHLGARERESQPHLDGEREFDAAIGAVGSALAVDPQPLDPFVSLKLGSCSAISFLSS